MTEKFWNCLQMWMSPWAMRGGVIPALGWLQSFACRPLIDRSSSEPSLASVLQPRLRERLDRTCCASDWRTIDV